MPMIDMRIFSEVVREWEEAAHGLQGSAVLEKRLPLLGISRRPSTGGRQEHFGDRPQTPTTKGQASNARPLGFAIFDSSFSNKFTPCRHSPFFRAS